MDTQKLVIVGDSACGKTSLIAVFNNKQFLEEYIPTKLNDYFIDITVCDTNFFLHISDNSGEISAH